MEPSPSHDFAELVDLATERYGGAVIYANDEFFASKDNLLKAARPIFIEGKYTDRGKWMDGWETRRRRQPGHDFCIVRLGVPGVIHGVEVDTSHFKGNFPEACSLDACAVPGHPGAEQLLSSDTPWVEVLPRERLLGDSANRFALHSPGARFTHLRLHIYPDGGVARLRLYGEVLPEPRRLRGEIDLCALEHGGRVIAANDMFFGARHNLIQPGPSTHMGDGWETRRSRRPGPDWVVVRLCGQGLIQRVEVDTSHFKGNAPESCALAVCDAGNRAGADLLGDESIYTEVLPRTPLQPHTRHVFEPLAQHVPATHARFRIYPDGGVARLRLYGTLTPGGRARLGLAHLGHLSVPEAEAAFLSCCGSREWARRMTAARPFASLEQLRQAGHQIWRSLSRQDWLEAFAAHPRIGEHKEGSGDFARWSAEEQAAVPAAEARVREALAQVNREYEARFGHIYIVCAAGQGPEALLEKARHRLEHDPEEEIQVAAGEQQKITDLRLERMVLS